MATYRDGVAIVRDLVQVVFFITVAAITVLTYLKAKKTLLQPIRTEIFKEQLKLFTSLLEMFSGKGEFELRQEFHFEELLHANAVLLLDDYAQHFFEVEVDENKRPYSSELCPLARVSGKNLVAADVHLWPGDSKASAKPTPETRAAIWNQYEFDMIKIPSALSAQEAKLERICSSPLITRELAQLLSEFSKTVDKDILALRKVFTACAKELPEKYPNLETMKKASTIWLQNRYNDEFHELEGPARKIAEYLRTYFKVDSLME